MCQCVGVLCCSAASTAVVAAVCSAAGCLQFIVVGLLGPVGIWQCFLGFVGAAVAQHVRTHKRSYLSHAGQRRTHLPTQTERPCRSLALPLPFPAGAAAQAAACANGCGIGSGEFQAWPSFAAAGSGGWLQRCDNCVVVVFAVLVVASE
jgi:hypothetical protein